MVTLIDLEANHPHQFAFRNQLNGRAALKPFQTLCSNLTLGITYLQLEAVTVLANVISDKDEVVSLLPHVNILSDLLKRNYDPQLQMQTCRLVSNMALCLPTYCDEILPIIPNITTCLYSSHGYVTTEALCSIANLAADSHSRTNEILSQVGIVERVVDLFASVKCDLVVWCLRNMCSKDPNRNSSEIMVEPIVKLVMGCEEGLEKDTLAYCCFILRRYHIMVKKNKLLIERIFKLLSHSHKGIVSNCLDILGKLCRDSDSTTIMIDLEIPHRLAQMLIQGTVFQDECTSLLGNILKHEIFSKPPKCNKSK